MSVLTTFLSLLKKNPTTDGNDTFNIETMLNENWDKVDAGIKTVSDALETHEANNTKQIPHLGTTTNSGNAYSIATSETIGANQKFTIKFNATSTDAATLNISTIGSAKGIKKPGGTNAVLKIGVYTLFWDGTNFQLLGEGGDYGTAGAAQTLEGYTIGTESGMMDGTMVDRSGDTAAVSSAVSGNTLRLRASEGYRDGTNDFVTITDNDWIEANIKSGIYLFDKLGTLVPAPVFAAGDVIIADNFGTGFSSNTGVWTKARELSMRFGGVYRVRFQISTSYVVGPADARIYVNGVARGTPRSTTETYPVYFEEDISINAGDLLQIYIHSNGFNINGSLEAIKVATGSIYTINL